MYRPRYNTFAMAGMAAMAGVGGLKLASSFYTASHAG